MKLQDHVHQLLQARGWSQDQLAEAIGFDPSLVARLLTGESPWRRGHIITIAAALSESPEEPTNMDVGAIARDDLDAEFMDIFTTVYGNLVNNIARANTELANDNQAIQQLTDERQRLYSEIHAAKMREEDLKTELFNLTKELEQSREQLAQERAKRATVTEFAYRHRNAATDLQRRWSRATRIATAVGGLALAGAIFAYARRAGWLTRGA